MLENFAAEAYLPAVQQWQINVEGYLSVVFSGLNLAARELATGVWDLPSAALDAVQLAAAGQFAEALTVIRDAIVGPIVAAAQSVLAAGTYVLNNVAAKASAVVAALPQIVTTFAGSAIGGASILAQKIAAIATGVVSSLSTLNLQGAWNTAVDGLLGPSGIPGTLLNLNTGAGVQTGPILDPVTDIPTNFVPSFRTALQAAQWTIRGASGDEAGGGGKSRNGGDGQRTRVRPSRLRPCSSSKATTSTAAADSRVRGRNCGPPPASTDDVKATKHQAEPTAAPPTGSATRSGNDPDHSTAVSAAASRCEREVNCARCAPPGPSIGFEPRR